MVEILATRNLNFFFNGGQKLRHPGETNFRNYILIVSVILYLNIYIPNYLSDSIVISYDYTITQKLTSWNMSPEYGDTPALYSAKPSVTETRGFIIR